MPVHVETMKLALLLLMLSDCLVDFVSARGVAMVGKAGNREARIKSTFQKTFIWRITSLSSVQSIVKNRFRIWSHITLTGLMEKLTIGIGWTGTFYWYWVSLKTTSWTQFIFPLAFCTNHHQGLILTLSIFSCPGTLLFLTKARFGSALVAGGILAALVVSTCCICCCLHYKRRKAEERRRQEEEEGEEKRKDREDSGRGHDEGRRVSSNTNTY